MTSAVTQFFGGPLDGSRENVDEQLISFVVKFAGGVRIVNPNAQTVYPGPIRVHHYTRQGELFVYAGESRHE